MIECGYYASIDVFHNPTIYTDIQVLLVVSPMTSLHHHPAKKSLAPTFDNVLQGWNQRVVNHQGAQI
jgi:hypothetical protein